MNILIVDDEEEILKMLKRHLELEGYDVSTTPDPFEAVELMKENLFNMVVSDIRMPGLSGVELLRELRAVNPLVNIIIITGYSNMSYVVDCLASGAVDYFTKPIRDMDLFLQVIGQTQKRMERWTQAMQIGESYGQTAS